MKKTRIRENIERIASDYNVGLNDEQVKIRQDKGYTNKVKSTIEKSIGKIIYDNVFTFFNVILFIIAGVFLFFIIYLYSTGNSDVVDKHFGFSKFVFLIPAFVNIMIGTIQEIRSRNVIRKLKIITEAKCKVIRNGEKQIIESSNLVIDDIVSLSPGDQATADLIVLSGEISVDESHLTGESDFIKKKPGDKILSGSAIMIGEGKCRVIEVGEDTYASQLSKKAKQQTRHKSELMTAIFNIIKLLSVALLVITITIVVSLVIKISLYGNDPNIWDGMVLSLTDPVTWARIMVTTGSFGIGMIPTGLVLTTSITLMLSIVYLASRKTLIQELYSLENLSRVDVICLDKTGTLTDGTMEVCDVKAYCNYNDVVDNIRDLVGTVENKNQTIQALYNKFGSSENIQITELIPFSSETKSSGFVRENGDRIVLGAPEYLLNKDDERLNYVNERAKEGNRVIAFTKNGELLCFFVLKDHIRDTARDTLKFFDENGVIVKIISGDNPFTVSKIAKECGVKDADKVISLEGVKLEDIKDICEEYTIFARVSPEQKEALVEALQANKHKVAMTGDGVNDILALRKSDSSITFSNATEAAKSCSDVILLDNDFSHMKEVVGEGRRVINNIQRIAVIFLMKSTAIILLALGLIPFAKGQMWYMVENAYLLELGVIGIGGLLLSFETKKEPIRGSFAKSIYLKAAFGGVFAAIGLLLPIILNQVPKALGYTPIISDVNVKTMMTLLLVITGLIVTISMCVPLNKYRVFCITATMIVILILVLAIPNTYLGGLVTGGNMFTFDANAGQTIFDSRFFQEAFKPWNSVVVQNLISDENNYYLMRVFMFIAIPSYLFITNIINRSIEKEYTGKKKRTKKSFGQILLLLSSFVLIIEGLVTIVDIFSSIYVFNDEKYGDLKWLLIIVFTILNLINIALYFTSGLFGYKVWKNGKYKKVAFIMAICMFVWLLLFAIIGGVDMVVSESSLTTIDSITALVMSFMFMIGATITLFEKPKTEIINS